MGESWDLLPHPVTTPTSPLLGQAVTVVNFFFKDVPNVAKWSKKINLIFPRREGSDQDSGWKFTLIFYLSYCDGFPYVKI